jgi:hypothetical protein
MEVMCRVRRPTLRVIQAILVPIAVELANSVRMPHVIAAHLHQQGCLNGMGIAWLFRLNKLVVSIEQVSCFD